jgi:hypothetical protein
MVQISEDGEDSKYVSPFSTFQALRLSKLELPSIAREILLQFENVIKSSSNAVK